jgi:hypothetical protein
LSDEALAGCAGGVIHNSPTLRPPSGGGSTPGAGGSTTFYAQTITTAVDQAQNALSNAIGMVNSAENALIDKLKG